MYLHREIVETIYFFFFNYVTKVCGNIRITTFSFSILSTQFSQGKGRVSSSLLWHAKVSLHAYIVYILAQEEQDIVCPARVNEPLIPPNINYRHFHVYSAITSKVFPLGQQLVLDPEHVISLNVISSHQNYQSHITYTEVYQYLVTNICWNTLR